MKNSFNHRQKNTSWQSVSKWYNKSLGSQGDYYHKHIVIPKTLGLLALKKDSSLLDLACGQGILERGVPESVYYHGIDIAPSLIVFAKRQTKNPKHFFMIGDVAQPLSIEKKDFTHAAVILALQNIKDTFSVLKNAFLHLQNNGCLLLVLNHPCFRIPRQSSWGIDDKRKIEYRRVDRYFSELEIPISANPSQQKKSGITWSFHKPVSSYIHMLKKTGFVVEDMQEWVSDKESVGKAAKMENRARQEFPLFLAIVARKIS